MPSKKIEKDFLKMGELYAKLYFHLSAEYCRTFGQAGEKALRKAIRQYGIDRGKTLRDDHIRRGYPIHLKTLFSVGGFPGKAGFRRNLIELRSDRRISETLQCVLNDSWKQMGGLREGTAYCEEIHNAMWSAYHPEIETRQPKIMTRGDELCRFEVLLSSAMGQGEAERVHEVSPQEYLEQLGDLQGKMYYYLGRGLCEEFGLEGEAALRRAIRRFGRERGCQLRKEHLEKGLEIDLNNLFTHYDLPEDARYRRNKIELTNETRLSETLECSYYNIWNQYPDGNVIGRIYCEEVHHEIFGGYDEAVQTNLCCTLTQGDDRCRFSVYLRPANKIPPPAWEKEYEDEHLN